MKEILIFCLLVGFAEFSLGGNSDRIRLSDVQTLTLYAGRYTAGRRSAPVPQLKCVGGSAKGEFNPQTVQCYNRGSDGNDVQWECKTDMDNDYRFGSIQVSCEGYDYPDDPYILKGSCGVRWNTLWSIQSKDTPRSTNTRTTTTAIMGVMNIINMSITISRRGTRKSSSARYRGSGPPPSAPPPAGFRPEYSEGHGCSGTQTRTHTQRGGHTGPGFWTGFGAGGLLGYLFGGRNTGWNDYGYGYRTGPSWGGRTTYHYHESPSSFGSGGSSRTTGSSSNTVTGTRTASGFGGTSRR